MLFSCYFLYIYLFIYTDIQQAKPNNWMQLIKIYKKVKQNTEQDKAKKKTSTRKTHKLSKNKPTD